MKIKITKKRLGKILTICLGCLAIGAILSSEIIIASRHEVEWQISDANTIYDDITMNLDMVQISMQVGDIEMYNTNLNSALSRIADLDKLYLVIKKHDTYIAKLDEYLTKLDSKRDLANDVVILRTDMANTESSLKNLYGDKTKLTRDTLKSAPTEIVKLKLDPAKYSTDYIKNIVATTNTMLDNVSTKVSDLAKCIDTCYVDSFTSTNNSLGDILKKYTNDISEVNKTIDAEFDFANITTLKSERPGTV